MVAVVVVVLDDCGDGGFEFTLQEIVFRLNADRVDQWAFAASGCG
jgi:hypothetical protein